jgi:hypothetical protein
MVALQDAQSSHAAPMFAHESVHKLLHSCAAPKFATPHTTAITIKSDACISLAARVIQWAKAELDYLARWPVLRNRST